MAPVTSSVQTNGLCLLSVLKLTSYADNALIGDDQFHTYVMSLGGNRPVDQLEIVAQPDQVGRSAGVLQKAIIKTLAVADTVTGQIKGNSRNHDQVGLVRLVVAAG